LTADPFGGSAKPQNPSSWNRYSYVENDPINKNDPSGLEGVPTDPYQGLYDLVRGRDRIDEEGVLLYSERFLRRFINHQQVLIFQDNFKAFLNEMSSECKKALEPYLADIEKKVDTIRLYDLDYWGDPNNPNVNDVRAINFVSPGMIIGRGLDPRTATVSNWFDQTFVGQGAVTVTPMQGRRPGIYFRGFQTFSSNMYLAAHEYTHAATGLSDIELARQFMINVKEGERPTEAVSRFFNSGCKDRGQ
jgi:hypothetical protein